MDQTRIYISSRNRDLARRAILSQPSLDETAARPVPAHIPGQMSLFTLHYCPTKPRVEGDIVGCGAVFRAEPDSEGIIDCPACGMWQEVGRGA